MKKLLPYIVLAAVLLVVVGILMFRRQREFDERVTFSVTQQTPYACKAVYELLPQFFPGTRQYTNSQSPRHWQVLSEDSSNQVLIIVNADFHPSYAEMQHLLAFARKGNTVLISTADMNETAQHIFKITTSSVGTAELMDASPGNIDNLLLKLDSTAFDAPLAFSYPGMPYGTGFRKTDTDFTYTLGYCGKLPNLLGMHIGEGKVILHSTPIAFTNFFTLYQHNYAYIQKILRLSQTPVRKVIWDEYFLYETDERNTSGGGGALSVILKYVNFRWALFVTMALLLIYVLTAVKRKQRLIPVYAKPANDSLAFVKTVSELYYEKGDHKNLAEKLTLYFLDYVRNRYKMSTQTINQEFARSLAVKAAVPEEDTIAIVDFIHTIQLQGTLSGEQLMRYHAILETFYQKA